MYFRNFQHLIMFWRAILFEPLNSTKHLMIFHQKCLAFQSFIHRNPYLVKHNIFSWYYYIKINLVYSQKKLFKSLIKDFFLISKKKGVSLSVCTERSLLPLGHDDCPEGPRIF